jgi:hypothetical protein
MDGSELEDRFASAAMRLGAHRDIGGVSAQVLARYREPHRHYHGASHLAGGLRVLDEIADTLVSAAEVELAFWFHDAVYATHPLAQNEERSAELAYEACLRMGIRARLEGVHPWSDPYFVTHYPPTGRSPARLGVSFGPLDDRALMVDVDDPDASELVARLRSVPGYRHDVETRPDSPARLVYSRGRCGRVEAPVRAPAARTHAGYR